MTFKNEYHPYEHFVGTATGGTLPSDALSLAAAKLQQNKLDYTTMGTTGNLNSSLSKGVSELSNHDIDTLDETNNKLVQYNDTLRNTITDNSRNLFTQAKNLRDNQQTLLNQSNSLEVKSNYYDTKQKQNAFSIEKNKYRENIFRLLFGLNIILLFVILFIINKA